MHALLLEIAHQKDPDALALAQAVAALPGVVGVALAGHCEVAGLRGGVLQVRCGHPAIRSELSGRGDLAADLGVDGVTAVEIL